MKNTGALTITFLVVLSLLLFCEDVYAYIGPGAGFAFFSSFLVFIVTFILFVFYIISLPVRIILNIFFRKKKSSKGKFRQVVILGLDGMDPALAMQFMKQGKLPNFQRLKDRGVFAPLSTSFPSISPVAWSSFMTGVDPSFHGIFDFFTRDPVTYTPILSSAEIRGSSKALRIGKYVIPVGKPRLRMLRKSRPFWSILGEHGVFSSILRVPITFPPEKFNGLLLSGMCVPDLNGSQGTFSFYTTEDSEKRGKTGGACYTVGLNSSTVNTFLYGPENSFVRGGERLKTPLTIMVDEESMSARIKVCDKDFELRCGNYSSWVRVTFSPVIGIKIRGICRFYLKQISPHLELYVTPINIDPERPVLPISHPFIYSIYLSKMIGPYATLGLAEDTWALNEGIIDEDAFLEQAYNYCEEREKMFFKALEKNSKGLCVCVFDTTDRIQHMFFRCLDDSHPANRGKEVDKYRNVIEDLYVRMDDLLGRVLEKIDEKTLLIVMSDHGFKPFRRGVNLNSWLFQNGYLVLKDGRQTSGDWFENVEWSRTRAYSLGLTGIFINMKGRESMGIVGPGREFTDLKNELVEKLTGFIDEDKGETAIMKAVYAGSIFSGPYVSESPDILINYNIGYRSSWACATGRVTESVFEDNTKRWSGDHCVAPNLAPGIFFSNYPINTSTPDIKDIAPTVLKAFGVETPLYMKGMNIITDHEKNNSAI
jgi:predicted AlkP superfamily phosphohydrolase/phosphomutase